MRRSAAVLAFALSFGLLITGCDSGLTGPEEQPEALTPKTSQQGPADEAKLSQQLNAVREATKKYRDVQAARDDGYTHVSPFVPGMGFHFERIEEGDHARGKKLDDPPILVYFPNGSYNPAPFEPYDEDRDDDLILGAVEYAVDSEGEEASVDPNIFADEESNRNLKVSEEHGWHWTPPLAGHALHAWVHRGNPAGVFHPTNPTIE